MNRNGERSKDLRIASISMVVVQEQEGKFHEEALTKLSPPLNGANRNESHDKKVLFIYLSTR